MAKDASSVTATQSYIDEPSGGDQDTKIVRWIANARNSDARNGWARVYVAATGSLERARPTEVDR